MTGNKNLKTLRKAKGYTQESMASAIGVKLGAYRNLEQGINEPDNKSLIRIVELLETTADYILERTDNPAPRTNGNPRRRYLMDKIAKADDKKLDKFQKLMELIDDEENGHHE